MSTIRLPLMGNKFIGQGGVPRHSQYHLCSVGQAVQLMREPGNSRDPNAVIANLQTSDGDWVALGRLCTSFATLL